ncbi:hypothetical protein GCM10022214_41500 [Actinomadura miaoliensis]|uniref:Histidine kinase/HSP90-like ATPase domain-containing protein n=1 Tax=Actinomadura miaoliensis TaxID=430685 RepID=A0ABP7W1C4_9ACTN
MPYSPLDAWAVVDVRRLSRLFEGRPESISEARAFAWAFMVGRVPDELADQVALVVSELCTNAVEHTASGEVGGKFVLELEVFPEHVRVSVVDMGAPSLPKLSCEGADLEAVNGRGLFIVDAVSKAWGSQVVRVGRRVWADVAGASV